MTQGESFVRPYVQELRLSLRNNVGAYGYSVMITCCLSMLSARLHTPQPGELFWFIIGAVASFGLIEAIATRGFQRPLASGEPTQEIGRASCREREKAAERAHRQEETRKRKGTQEAQSRKAAK